MKTIGVEKEMKLKKPNRYKAVGLLEREQYDRREARPLTVGQNHSQSPTEVPAPPSFEVAPFPIIMWGMSA